MSSRKSKKINGHDFPRSAATDHAEEEEEEDDNDVMLTLSLSSFSSQNSTAPAPPSVSTLPRPLPFGIHNPPSSHSQHSLMFSNAHDQSVTTLPPPEAVRHSDFSGCVSAPSRARARRNPSRPPREAKSETIPQHYPWATDRRATVHSASYLLSRQIFTISGDVHCKKCERRYVLEYDLRRKFDEIGTFIAENKARMHDRAPKIWMNPILQTCRYCEQENSLKPVIAEKKKAINWLFLLLGQTLGCCSLEQLKYFCKHTKNHRTGAKDRVLYLTYLGLCKQLDADGPFNR